MLVDGDWMNCCFAAPIKLVISDTMLISVSDFCITIQHRVAQENLLYKDEQVREAQNWMARMQENVLQSTTMQAELRERTEQYSQLWLGCQRQVEFWTFNESILHLCCCFYEFFIVWNQAHSLESKKLL